MSDCPLLSDCAAAIEPPALMLQNSYRPSKPGQSSPVRTVRGVGKRQSRLGKDEMRLRQQLTSCSSTSQAFHSLRGDLAQEVNVLVGMEPRHRLCRRALRPDYLHVPLQSIVGDEVVCHAHAMRLHWMAVSVRVVPNVGCKWVDGWMDV
jgi:hypothetical protein